MAELKNVKFTLSYDIPESEQVPIKKPYVDRLLQPWRAEVAIELGAEGGFELFSVYLYGAIMKKDGTPGNQHSDATYYTWAGRNVLDKDAPDLAHSMALMALATVKNHWLI